MMPRHHLASLLHRYKERLWQEGAAAYFATNKQVHCFECKALWEGSFEAKWDKTNTFNISAYGSPCQIFFWEIKPQYIYYFSTWAS